MNKINVDKTYVCHYTKLVERKQYMLQHLLEAGIEDVRWVEYYDKDSWCVEEILREYPKVFDFIPNESRKMNYAEISLALKHCWIIKDIASNKHKSALVLEDDVLLCGNFIETFNKFKDELPRDWDCCWVGSCCDLHAEVTPNSHVYVGRGSRCTHAFLVSYTGAEKILPLLSTLDYPADHFYNKLIIQANLNNYWFEPSLASQRYDLFKTTVQNKN